MGISNGKQTLDLASLKSMQDDLSEMRDEIESMQSMLDEANGVTDQRAVERLTVRVIDPQNHDNVLGRGMLVTVNQHLYLLSAAHVLIQLAALRSFNINDWYTYYTETNRSVHCAPHSLYLPRSYVEAGSRDYGLLRLQPLSRITIRQRQPLPDIHARINTGEAITADIDHVSVRGDVVRMMDCTRYMVHGIVARALAPGCSGCPIVNRSGELCAIMHGGMVDKAIGSLQAKPSDGEHVATAGRTNEFSDFAYYVDPIELNHPLMLINPSAIPLLAAAEGVIPALSERATHSLDDLEALAASGGLFDKLAAKDAAESLKHLYGKLQDKLGLPEQIDRHKISLQVLKQLVSDYAFCGSKQQILLKDAYTAKI